MHFSFFSYTMYQKTEFILNKSNFADVCEEKKSEIRSSKNKVTEQAAYFDPIFLYQIC